MNKKVADFLFTQNGTFFGEGEKNVEGKSLK